jgi:riboflavin kinase/FMN adenylyltransferase
MLVTDWDRFIDPTTAILEAPGAFLGGLCASIGVFDGVHRGHQELIGKILHQASERNGIAGVITFRQNPRSVLHPQHFLGNIYSLSQKLAALEALGVGLVVLIDFSGNFSKLSGKEFVRLMGRRRVDYLAVGANFRCGHKLDTDAQAIREMTMGNGTLTELVAPVREGGDPVSSSRIRQAILAGDINGASGLLGRPFSVELEKSRWNGAQWDLSGAGRVLPPTGRYPVMLRSATLSSGGTPELRTDIFFETGRISIDLTAHSEEFADNDWSAELLGSQ